MQAKSAPAINSFSQLIKIKKQMPESGIAALLLVKGNILLSYYDGNTVVLQPSIDPDRDPRKHLLKTVKVADNSLYLYHLLNPISPKVEIISAGLSTIDKFECINNKNFTLVQKNIFNIKTPDDLYFFHLTVFNNIELKKKKMNVLCALSNRGFESENSSIFLFDLEENKLLEEFSLPMRKGKITAADSSSENIIICTSSLLIESNIDEEELELLTTSIYHIDRSDMLELLKGRNIKDFFQNKTLEQEGKTDKYSAVCLHPKLKYFAVGSYSLVDFYKIEKDTKKLVLLLSFMLDKLKIQSVTLSLRVNYIAAHPLHPDIVFAICDGYGKISFFSLKKRKEFPSYSIPNDKKTNDMNFSIFKRASWTPDGYFLIYERNVDKKYTNQQPQAQPCYLGYEEFKI